MCKSNTRHVNVAINLWNTLPNSIKTVKFYVSFKMNIKSILLKLHTKCTILNSIVYAYINYNNLYLCKILFYYYITYALIDDSIKQNKLNIYN